jgi:GABA(A) receptor-associated protein
MNNNCPSFYSITPPVLTTQNNTIITTSASYLQMQYQESLTSNSATNIITDSTTSTAGNDYIEKLKKSQLILEKYPDRVPVIIQPSPSDRGAYPIDKSKYITPRELTLLQLQQIIRKRIKLPAEKALFMFINNKVFPITSIIGPLYDEYKNKDGFLYVTYCQESTFGGF